MKAIYIIFLMLILSGCNSVGYDIDYDIENIKPNEYGLNDSFTGRIFVVGCYGGRWAEVKDVDYQCREVMSELAYSKGYKYFTVIDKKDYSQKETRSFTTVAPISTTTNYSAYSGGSSAYGSKTSTTYVPQVHNYEVTEYSKSYMFLLIGEEERGNYNNYYKVLDYYTPPVATISPKPKLSSEPKPIRTERENAYRDKFSVGE